MSCVRRSRAEASESSPAQPDPRAAKEGPHMIRKFLAGLTATAVATFAALTLTSTAAHADPDYYGSLTPPAGWSGSGFWSVDTVTDQLYLSVNAGALNSGQCMTVYLDIARQANVPAGSGTHYDARAVRTCQSNSQRASGYQLEGSTYGINITGVQKVAICVGALNTTGTCRVTRGTLAQIQAIDPESSSANTCVRWWSRNSSGTNLYFSGGTPTSCSS
ncbi:hypothetical protein BJY16_007454 [Actinoplanes octamycinicus]|uniref:Uncharacterized protein n=1 Tax=Actinoplanes octamycinicus TaxID=135948 RepID=A0A7W7H4R8_9ACTN|nr:hypothetical protein [Actinoplanes octamycinicus]MBB4743995.1 hypothetical protein [Actinoplanes octamycinicus]